MDIRPLRLEDVQPWSELLSVCFDRSQGDMAKLLYWLHAGYPVVAWGAWDGDQLAAQYACLIMELYLPNNEESVRAGMSLNMAVHPTYRGRGLVKQVAQPVYQTVQDQAGIAGVGFSNAQGVRVDRQSQAYGYQVVGQMISTLAWLRPQRKPALTLSDSWPSDCAFPVHESDQVHFLTVPEHRFAQHPFRRYQYAIWREVSGVCGVIVYRQVTIAGLPAVALLAAYGFDLPELLARWSATLKVSHLVHLLTTPASHLRRALAQVAVTLASPYTRTPYFLTVKPLRASAGVSTLLNFSSWDAVGGDVL